VAAVAAAWHGFMAEFTALIMVQMGGRSLEELADASIAFEQV